MLVACFARFTFYLHSDKRPLAVLVLRMWPSVESHTKENRHKMKHSNTENTWRVCLSLQAALIFPLHFTPFGSVSFSILRFLFLSFKDFSYFLCDLSPKKSYYFWIFLVA